jgi:hypothetical protein
MPLLIPICLKSSTSSGTPTRIPLLLEVENAYCLTKEVFQKLVFTLKYENLIFSQINFP